LDLYESSVVGLGSVASRLFHLPSLFPTADRLSVVLSNRYHVERLVLNSSEVRSAILPFSGTQGLRRHAEKLMLVSASLLSSMAQLKFDGE